MKKAKIDKLFLEELRKIPNISFACEKVGLSRQTIYRWRTEDPKFSKAIENAISSGINHVNDLAKSKLITSIQNGEFKPIKYWLDNNDPMFYSPKFVAERKEKEINKEVEKVSILQLLKVIEIAREAKKNGEKVDEGNIDNYL